MNPSSRIVNDENVVFRLRRTDTEFDSSWAAAANAASLVLGYFEDIHRDELDTVFDPTVAQQLIAAARVFDTICSKILRSATNEEQLAIGVSYGELAASAFGMYGNFPAAYAVCDRILEFAQFIAPFHAACLCCCAPAHVGAFLNKTDQTGNTLRFIELYEAFLRAGSDEREDAARKALMQLPKNADSTFDEALWAAAVIAFEQSAKLSTVKVLSRFDNPMLKAFSFGLAGDGIKTFLPPQYLALTKHPLLTNRSNALLSLPTSTGKTLISELVIFDAVRSTGRIGIFVVPYVALGRQVSDRVSRHLPTDWRVVRLFGGFKEPGAFESSNHKTFVVATPERLDALLRFNPEIINRIDCVVFDEAHMIENGQRGVRVECLLARLLLLQSQNHKFRLITASAVVPNIDALSQWTDVPSENIIASSWVPNTKRIAIWQDSGRLIWYYSNDPVTPEGIRADQPMLSVNLPWPQRIIARTGSFQETRALGQANLENVAYICEYFWKMFREPVLCVCPTKETTRRVAAVLAARFDPLVPLPEPVQRAISLIATKFPHYTHLRSALERGVAYHNASLPHELRNVIEDAAQEKLIKIVLSTTTLAEGVDLPFRATVLADWLGYTARDQAPLSPLLVRNIAGRCGRVGYFTEGDVVVYDNPLGDRRFKRLGAKEYYQRRVIFGEGDEGVTSAAADQTADPAVRAAIESQFLAAVSENPEDPQLEETFVQHMFASWLHRGEKVEEVVSKTVNDLVVEPWRFATRSSPLTLTDLGEAVNRSGFSPSSCREILNVLSVGFEGFGDVEVGVQLLSHLGDLPEQADRKFSALVLRDRERSVGKMKKGAPKTFVRLDSLDQLLTGWLNGERPIDIFVNLPTVRRSKIKPPVSEWIQGTSTLTAWDGEFDKFCDFLRSTVFEFLPWLLRACALLADHLPQLQVSLIDWNGIAERYHCESVVTQRDDSLLSFRPRNRNTE